MGYGAMLLPSDRTAWHRDDTVDVDGMTAACSKGKKRAALPSVICFIEPCSDLSSTSLSPSATEKSSMVSKPLLVWNMYVLRPLPPVTSREPLPAVNVLLPVSAVTVAVPAPPVSVIVLPPMNAILSVPVPSVTVALLPAARTNVSPPTV